MIPMSMAGSGVFRTLALTEHSRTNMEVIERFLPVRIEAEERKENDVIVRFTNVASRSEINHIRFDVEDGCAINSV